MCADTSRTIVHRIAVDRILTRRFATVGADEAEKYVQNTLRLLSRDHLEPEPAIRTPLLVVTGEHDTYTPPDISRRVARTSTDGIFALIADADHMSHLERPRKPPICSSRSSAIGRSRTWSSSGRSSAPRPRRPRWASERRAARPAAGTRRAAPRRTRGGPARPSYRGGTRNT